MTGSGPDGLSGGVENPPPTTVVFAGQLATTVVPVPVAPDVPLAWVVKILTGRCFFFASPVAGSASANSRAPIRAKTSATGFGSPSTRASSHKRPWDYCFSSKALLRQPGGLQCFLVAVEESKPSEFALPDLDDYAGGLVELNGARTTAELDLPQGDNVLAHISPVLDDDVPVLEMLVDLGGPKPDSLHPAVRLGTETAHNLDILMNLVGGQGPLAAIPAVEPAPRHLDVPLCHPATQYLVPSLLWNRLYRLSSKAATPTARRL